MLLTYIIVNDCVYIIDSHINKNILIFGKHSSPYPDDTLDIAAQKYIQYLYDTLVQNKISEIKASCETTIITGFNCSVSGKGTLHYSLTKIKQDDMKALYQNIIDNKAPVVLWHADSKVMHEIYTAEQFMSFYQQAFAFIISQKIYSDGLEQWIKNLEVEHKYLEISNIKYGDALPNDIQTVVNSQINLMLGRSE